MLSINFTFTVIFTLLTGDWFCELFLFNTRTHQPSKSRLSSDLKFFPISLLIIASVLDCKLCWYQRKIYLWTTCIDVNLLKPISKCLVCNYAACCKRIYICCSLPLSALIWWTLKIINNSSAAVVANGRKDCPL